MSRSVYRPLAAFGALGVVALVIGAQAPGPVATPLDERTAKIVVNRLERQHMAKPSINDETAKKWCKTFLKDLDPRKTYFLKADVDEFLPQATDLDDQIKKGNLDFARQVFDRFLKRSDERFAQVLDILKEKPDFTLDESMPDDPELYDYPADDAAARERMRKQIKLELLQAKIDDERTAADKPAEANPEADNAVKANRPGFVKPGDPNKPADPDKKVVAEKPAMLNKAAQADKDYAEAVRKLTVRYRDRNRMVHQFNASDMLEFYLTSLGRTFDPHTNYMNRESVEDFMQQQIQLSLTGIGASLQSEDGYAVVKELIPGGPADKDGSIQPEDKIVGIILDDGKEVDFVEKRLRDVVRQIRGDANTHARLKVMPHDSKEIKVYDIVRQKVEMTESHAKGQIIETKADGKTLKIGVINMPAFYGDANDVSCTGDCRRLIEGFKDKGVDAVMMDLRGNGGGLLNEAISLSGLFIDKGPVVQVRDVTGVKHLDDDEEGTAWDGPLVVLIDRQSASASEIFAGVIKDYGRGLIIGDSSTYGKGTVQQIIPINESFSLRAAPTLGALKLTIQQFYRVNGDSTQIRGVEPDIHIPSIFDMADFGEGKMENALKFDHVAARPHDQFNRVPADLVAQLNDRSNTRRGQSEKFRKRDSAIKQIIERKNRHSISLNEVKFRAETFSEEENKDEVKTAKPKEKRKRLSEHPAWEPNFYNDEVVNIVGDYLTIGQKVFAAAPIKAAAND